MTIWIFNPFDDIPGEGPKLRFWTLAELLAEAGHEVVWWSADFSHRRKEGREEGGSGSGKWKVESRRSEIGYRISKIGDGRSERGDRSRVRENVGGFSMRLVPVRPYARNISLRRMLSHRDYGRALVREGRKESKRPDIIVASTPPLEGGKAALELKKHFGCRVVIDVMDAWPDTFYRAMPRGRWLFFLYERLANRLMREADAVSAQSQAFAAWAKRRGYPGEPHVVYLGTEIGGRISERGDGSSEFGEGGGANRPLTFLYLGSMGAVYDLETVIAAAAVLKQKGHVFRLELAGGGEKEAFLRAKVEELGLQETVYFRGYLQGEALEAFLAAGDVALCPMFPASQVAVPYKACEYAGAGLPMINSLPGELTALLFRYQAGRFYQAGDVISLSALMELYIEHPEWIPAESQAARKLALDHFDREKTYREWAEWIVEPPREAKWRV